jgi:hypothetical protein
MGDQRLSTGEKALALDLDRAKYGTIAEIGGGQEGARGLLHAGAAAQHFAKFDHTQLPVGHDHLLARWRSRPACRRTRGGGMIAPLLVLASYLIAPEPLALASSRAEIGSLFIAVLIGAMVCGDGQSNW